MVIDYKRNEDKIIAGIKQYIDSTYSAHYSSSSGRDVVDDWDDAGITKEMCLGNMIKYVKRFGKKEGYNPKDIMKVIHYGIFLLNELQNEDKVNDDA